MDTLTNREEDALMRSRKALAAAALAALMALLAAGFGCSSAKQDEHALTPTEAPSVTESIEATAEPAEPTEEPTAAPTATPDPERFINIGVTHTAYSDSGEETEEYSVYADYASFTADVEPLTDEELSASMELNTQESYNTTYIMIHRNVDMMEDYYNVTGSLFLNSEIKADTFTEDGRKTLWTYTTDQMYVWDHFVTDDAVYLIGNLPYDDFRINHDYDEDVPGVYYYRETADGQTIRLKKYDGPIREEKYPAVMKLSPEGEFQWMCSWDNGWTSESIRALAVTPDGGIAAFSNHYEYTEEYELTASYLVCSFIDPEGEHRGSVINETDTFVRVKKAFVIEDGFAAACDDGDTIGISETNGVAIFDGNGRLTDRYTFSCGDIGLHFFETAVCNNKLFLCTYMTDPDDVVYEWLKGEGTHENGDDITGPMREKASSILLVFDLCGQAQINVYEAFAAYGGYHNGLHINDEGCMVWYVPGILSAEYSAASSYILNCRFKVNFCRFDEEGRLVETGFTGRAG